MSDAGSDTGAPRPPLRGEAAWKAHLARVAARNDEARTAGKKQRQDKERAAEVLRNAQERRVDNELTRKFEMGA
jgi:hypothetical protein